MNPLFVQVSVVEDGGGDAAFELLDHHARGLLLL